MSLYHIAAEYNDNGPLEKRLMRIVTTIDAIWLNGVQPTSSNWTSKSSYEVVASLLRRQSVRAATMSLYTITAEYNGPLEAPHAHGDDDKGDLAECGAAGQLKLDLSEQLRRCSIASTFTIRPSSNYELVSYRRRV